MENNNQEKQNRMRISFAVDRALNQKKFDTRRDFNNFFQKLKADPLITSVCVLYRKFTINVDFQYDSIKANNKHSTMSYLCRSYLEKEYNVVITPRVKKDPFNYQETLDHPLLLSIIQDKVDNPFSCESLICWTEDAEGNSYMHWNLKKGRPQLDEAVVLQYFSR